MKVFWPILLRATSGTVGILLLLMSALLFESEEGVIQNKLEKWWIALSDAKRVAVAGHAAFVSEVARSETRIFDRLFGTSLLSVQSIGVSACFSLASLWLVCSPAFSIFAFWIPDAISTLYIFIVIALIALGIVPAIFHGRRVPRRCWLVGTAAMVLVCLLQMHIVDWFNLYHRGVVYEVSYDLAFIIAAFASDAAFIAATRWLVRKASEFQTFVRVVGVLLANVILASILVVLPALTAWRSFKSRFGFTGSTGIADSIRSYTVGSNSNEIFLTTLAASNVLDAIAAGMFFILLTALLLHRLVWPAIERPVYAIAARGVVRRRKLFFALGWILIVISGIPNSKLSPLLEKIASALTDW